MVRPMVPLPPTIVDAAAEVAAAAAPRSDSSAHKCATERPLVVGALHLSEAEPTVTLRSGLCACTSAVTVATKRCIAAAETHSAPEHLSSRGSSTHHSGSLMTSMRQCSQPASSSSRSSGRSACSTYEYVFDASEIKSARTGKPLLRHRSNDQSTSCSTSRCLRVSETSSFSSIGNSSA